MFEFSILSFKSSNKTDIMRLTMYTELLAQSVGGDKLSLYCKAAGDIGITVG